MDPIISVDTQSIRPQTFLYPLIPWVLMAVIAVLNGGFREVVLIPRVGDYTGHLVSTGLLVSGIILVSFIYFRLISTTYAPIELVLVGFIWTVLTVGFEFLVGYIEGTPVSVTLGQYNVLAGEVWIAVPITLLFSPIVFGWYLSL